jgi:phenylacetate-CoA ligase
MLDPHVEGRPWEEQLALDDGAYRAQLAYLLERSPFYREKLGLSSSDEAGGLAEIAALPLTEKPELKATATEENPVGAHLCVDRSEIVRIYSTSGTTGTPSYIPLTARDLDDWVTGSARSYAASGISAGQRIVSTYNAGPFVAGAALASFDVIGLCHIPIGTGNTERLIRAIELLRPEAAVLTPSYAAHLLEWTSARGLDLRSTSVERVLVAGEPGGGEQAFRARLEEGWGARVTEAMGIGDIGISLWGECEEQDGMHLGARGFVHPELIDPATGESVATEDGASGELVLTHLRHRAAPLLRFRTRDHVHVRMSPCPCGRTGPRVRCVGRTDDMLIVRGVNVFPAAIRDVVGGFAPRVSGHIRVRPAAEGVKQEPPLPVSVELAEGVGADEDLAETIRERIRAVLVVQTRVELVPWGSLERSEYKGQLVERSG